jgi:hypothetical protein
MQHSHDHMSASDGSEGSFDDIGGKGLMHPQRTIGSIWSIEGLIISFCDIANHGCNHVEGSCAWMHLDIRF